MPLRNAVARCVECLPFGVPLVPCVVPLVPFVVPLVPCVVPPVPFVVPLVPCVVPLSKRTKLDKGYPLSLSLCNRSVNGVAG